MVNKDSHCFSVAIAAEVGLEEAIILQHLYYWCYGNADNESMNKDGHIWVYISRTKIAANYPYLSVGRIKGAISRLQKEGYIIVANYNKRKMDKTNWYALTDKGYDLFGTSIERICPTMDKNESSLAKTDQSLAKIANDWQKQPTIGRNSQAIQSIEVNFKNKDSREEKEKKEGNETSAIEVPGGEVHEEVNKGTTKKQPQRTKKVTYQDVCDLIAEQDADAVAEWLEYKQGRNEAYTLQGFKIMYKRLGELSNHDPQMMLQIVEQSIVNSWRGLFAVKEYNNNYNNNNNGTTKPNYDDSYKRDPMWKRQQGIIAIQQLEEQERIEENKRLEIERFEREYERIRSGQSANDDW